MKILIDELTGIDFLNGIEEVALVCNSARIERTAELSEVEDAHENDKYGESPVYPAKAPYSSIPVPCRIQSVSAPVSIEMPFLTASLHTSRALFCSDMTSRSS